MANNGRIFATGGHDHMVKLWDFQTGALIMNGVGHSGLVSFGRIVVFEAN